MRYENWDVLIFPSGRESKVPTKEFKVACHVVPDGEFSHCHGAHGLPVMTCFIPSFQSGTRFHISIHSWKTPEISQFTRSFSKHQELVKFEARILVDGRLVASTSFDRIGQWPHLINNTFELTKNGEFEPLKFPPFRRELLYQNHWNPGDDTGRIKVVISEGFPRDSLSTPIERIKNTVAFSFQHAPMDILESNGIAWPNPHMWRGPTLSNALPVPTYHPDEGSDSHSHSPRRRSFRMMGSSSQGHQVPLIPAIGAQSSAMMNPVLGQNISFGLRPGASTGSSCPDPFTEPAAYRDWLNSLGLGQLQVPPTSHNGWPGIDRTEHRHSNTDVSMGYGSSVSSQHLLPDQMHISGPSLDDDYAIDAPKAPTNTPTTATPQNGGVCHGNAGNSLYGIHNSVIPGELATSLTHSLLNQPLPMPVFPHQIPLPASEVRSRKENRQAHMPAGTGSPTVESPTAAVLDNRKFSQATFGTFAAAGTTVSGSASRVSSGSPSSGPAFSASASRNTSGPEFGANLTNMAEPPQSSANPSMTVGSDKSLKRARNFTPASGRDPDDDDQPLRPSPHVRLSPYNDKNIVD